MHSESLISRSSIMKNSHECNAFKEACVTEMSVNYTFHYEVSTIPPQIPVDRSTDTQSAQDFTGVLCVQCVPAGAGLMVVIRLLGVSTLLMAKARQHSF